jgi:prophage antirepressor-like protein
MNELMTFTNAEFGKLRTIETDKGVYFVGKDVAQALGYKNSRQAILHNVDEKDRGVYSVDTPSGVQQMSAINESGLYALILGSRKREAVEFKHWVTSEVLPSIYRTGSYSMTSENQSDVKLVTITSEMAEIMLEKNIANRKVNQAKVAQIFLANIILVPQCFDIKNNHGYLLCA